MTKFVAVGEVVKVHLPGETPWAEVMSVDDDGSFVGRIDNKLYSEYSEFENAQFMNESFGTVEKLPVLHDYKFNDLVRFAWTEEPKGYWGWRPAPQQGEG